MKTYKRYAAAILAALMLAACSQTGTPVNDTDIHNGSQEITLAKKQNETDEVKSLAKPVLPEILPYPDQTKITDWDKYE
ncbi:MAG: hypothetical protein IKR73_01670, partial [Oscillospiraceae bacterium]|nr:hypothetical protein [Oscillospiraceae bacterium]